MTHTLNVSSFVWKGKNHNFLIIAIIIHIAIFASFLFEKKDSFEPISFGVQFSINSQFKPVVPTPETIEEKAITTTGESKIAHTNSNENHEKPQSKTTEANENQETSTANAQDDSSAVQYTIGSSENPAPNYPAIAKRNEWQGVSQICATVDSTGAVKSATTCGSSGYDVLDASAVQAVSGWKFKIKQTGKELYNVRIKINFILE